jgi:formylglycine-generating enzyme required for sulfatase activity
MFRHCERSTATRRLSLRGVEGRRRWLATSARGLLAMTGLMAASMIASVPTAMAADYVPITAGELRSVLPPDGKSAKAKLGAFAIRSTPVTVGEFQDFVARHPLWRRDQVPAIFADSSYLATWAAPDLAGGEFDAAQPVTAVSWFAAAAYCESEQARLPSWHQWEYVAAADETRKDARDDPAWRERILGWYAHPASAPLARVGQGPANAWGARDMHGLIWEWVDDYAGMMISGDNRNQGDPEILKFCGAGALSTQDRENYAILMRVALLSSLDARQSTRNLGFRCVRDNKATPP